MSALKVRDVMSRAVHTVSTRASLLGAARVMRRQRVSGLPVLDGASQLVGIVSEKDIVRDLNRAAGVASDRGLLELLLAARRPNHPTILDVCEQRLLRARVTDVMTREVVTVHPDDSVGEAIRKLRTHGIKRLPVVDGRRVVGIVTRNDLLGDGTLALGLPLESRSRSSAAGSPRASPIEGAGPLLSSV
ncbi:MAG TPA: CBS domain-containing protein [Thermoplasmata archaeon]|nr:CBS domain-containing protein [Thermoplasmata archaeon]